MIRDESMWESVFAGIESGESKAISLVREMDPANKEEIIHKLVMKVEHPEPAPLRRIEKNVFYLFDFPSFIDYAKIKGNSTMSLIVYDECGIRFLQDSSQEFSTDAEFSGAFMYFKSSPERMVWDQFWGLPLSQKDFLKILKRNRKDIGDWAEIYNSYSALETTINLKRDSRFGDDRHMAVEFTSKTENKTKPGSLLKNFQIEIPVFDKDLGLTPFEIEIDVVEPEAQGTEAMFELLCPDWETAWRDRISLYIEQMRSELADWLILFGETKF